MIRRITKQEYIDLFRSMAESRRITARTYEVTDKPERAYAYRKEALAFETVVQVLSSHKFAVELMQLYKED